MEYIKVFTVENSNNGEPVRKQPLKHVNEQSKKVLTAITTDLQDGHKKLDNAPGTFMALSVEDISMQYDMEAGSLFSLAHYGEQNGDAMRDPEMIFWKASDGEFYPVYFRNDYVGTERVSVKFESGKFAGYYPREQKDEAAFANIWLRNIKHQQNVVTAHTPRTPAPVKPSLLVQSVLASRQADNTRRAERRPNRVAVRPR